MSCVICLPLIKQDFKENETNKEKDKERLRTPSGAGGGIKMILLVVSVQKVVLSLPFSFAKDMGMNTDILKLPQQLKSMIPMLPFAKACTIGTLGFDPRIVKDIQLVLNQFGSNIKNMIKTSVGTPILNKFDEFAKFVKNSTLGVFKSFDTKVL